MTERHQLYMSHHMAYLNSTRTSESYFWCKFIWVVFSRYVSRFIKSDFFPQSFSPPHFFSHFSFSLWVKSIEVILTDIIPAPGGGGGRNFIQPWFFSIMSLYVVDPYLVRTLIFVCYYNAMSLCSLKERQAIYAVCCCPIDLHINAEEKAVGRLVKFM